MEIKNLTGKMKLREDLVKPLKINKLLKLREKLVKTLKINKLLI